MRFCIFVGFNPNALYKRNVTDVLPVVKSLRQPDVQKFTVTSEELSDIYSRVPLLHKEVLSLCLCVTVLCVRVRNSHSRVSLLYSDIVIIQLSI